MDCWGLKKDMHKIGIQWQKRLKKKWLAELLVNERAVGPLQSYLKNTKVGSRDRAAEMTKEQRRKNDKEGEKYLENSQFLSISQNQEDKAT